MNNILKKQYKQELSIDTKIKYLYTDVTPQENIDKSLEEIFDQIKNTSYFSLGEYKDKNKLKSDLRRKIFGKSKTASNLHPFTKKDLQKIIEINESIFKKSFDSLPISGDIIVYVIPFCNEEASLDLKGVNAFPVEGNILYLFIDTKNNEWEKSLKETIPHEYAHLVYTSVFEWNSILDGFVNEGLAEKFREFLVGGEIAPWSKALDKNYALNELCKLNEKKVLNLFIDDSNVDFYISYFFGTEKLPKWYGYSIGYWMIEEIIENKKINLIDLFQKNPKEIYLLWKKDQSS